MANETDTESSRIVDINALSAKVDKLAELVEKILPGSHDEAQTRTEEHLDRPSTVEEQVRAELARAREEEQRAQADTADKEDVKTRLAKLEETPPAQPVPRRTRMLGWGQP